MHLCYYVVKNYYSKFYFEGLEKKIGFMKNDMVKKALPHVIAIIIFLVVTMFFGRLALEGNMLDQGDIDGWRGIAQNAFDYKSQHGHYPLWNPNVFSGMPNYMIVMEGKSILPDITAILSFGLPQPINQFFIACLCFYILSLTVGARPIVGIFGALAFAFATYNPIIIEAGHVTKMFAIAYMPLLLAGLINVYEKRYWPDLHSPRWALTCRYWPITRRSATIR
jgi:hypothetical protein